MSSGSDRSRAEFEVVERPTPYDEPLYPNTVTRCKACGWETNAKNHSLYGDPNELDLALVAHRLAHVEGRV